MSQALLQINHVYRHFAAGDETLTVLKDVNLTIERGEMVAIVGASGSGKSTLMNILGCLDQPSAGEYWINGQDTSTLDSDELARLRREYFGFIFQRYHLLGDLTALGNVEIPRFTPVTTKNPARNGPHRFLAASGFLIVWITSQTSSVVANSNAFRSPELWSTAVMSFWPTNQQEHSTVRAAQK